jgi:universal stress protein F
MFKTVLVPIDPAHGEVADRILSIAGRLLDDDGRITVLFVIEPLPSYIAGHVRAQTLDDRIRENRAAAMATLETIMTRAGVSGRAILDEGTAASAILRIAREIQAEAIVLGSHRPDFRDYLIGSTAARVVHHAQCTVIVDRATTTAF